MIDFHCHLDLYPNPKEVVRESVKNKIYILSVTTTPSAWTITSLLTEKVSRIRTGLGLHPQIAHERKHELSIFDKFVSQTKYIGEIGLDGSIEYKNYLSDQTLVFEHILKKCQAVGGKVLSIHSRRASTPVLDYLEKYPEAGVPILHWFSGSTRELERAIKLGCWFSVGPTMLNSKKGRELAGKMPSERVLTESDGPFAKINGHPAYPWDVSLALKSLGEIWGTSPSNARKKTLENLRRLTEIKLG